MNRPTASPDSSTRADVWGVVGPVVLVACAATIYACIRDDAWAQICVTADPDVFSDAGGQRAHYCVNGSGPRAATLLPREDGGVASATEKLIIPGTIVVHSNDGDGRELEFFVQATLPESLRDAGVECAPCGEVQFVGGMAPTCVRFEGTARLPAEGHLEYRAHLSLRPPRGGSLAADLPAPDDLPDGGCP